MKKHFIKLLFSFSICLTFLQANAQFPVKLNNGYVRVGFSDVSSSWSTNDMFYLQWDPGTGIVELRNKTNPPIATPFCNPTDVYRIEKIGSDLIFRNLTSGGAPIGTLSGVATRNLFISVYLFTGMGSPYPQVNAVSPNFSDKCGVENSWTGMGTGTMQPVVSTDKIKINNIPQQDTLDTVLVTNYSGIIHKRKLADWYEVGNVPHLPNDIND